MDGTEWIQHNSNLTDRFATRNVLRQSSRPTTFAKRNVNGDSGSPNFIKSADKYYALGVTSYDTKDKCNPTWPVTRCWDLWIQEISFTRRLDSGRPRQTSRQEDHCIVRNARVQPTASAAAIQAQVAPSLGAPVSSRTIQKRLAEGHLGLIAAPIMCAALDAYLSTVWSGAAYEETVLQRNGTSSSLPTNLRHTTPTAGVMACSAIAHNTRPTLVLILGAMTVQRYVHDILQPHVLPLTQWLPGAIFQQDNARPHMARVSQDCLRTLTTFPWPTRSPDLSPNEHT
ncbi:transposable element Tcb1 transposase [Trichonephila clavipes]|nr:transposable element Tcb1 transposase [Trichonephila clavipes]